MGQFFFTFGLSRKGYIRYRVAQQNYRNRLKKAPPSLLIFNALKNKKWGGGVIHNHFEGKHQILKFIHVYIFEQRSNYLLTIFRGKSRVCGCGGVPPASWATHITIVSKFICLKKIRIHKIECNMAGGKEKHTNRSKSDHKYHAFLID